MIKVTTILLIISSIVVIGGVGSYIGYDLGLFDKETSNNNRNKKESKGKENDNKEGDNKDSNEKQNPSEGDSANDNPKSGSPNVSLKNIQDKDGYYTFNNRKIDSLKKEKTSFNEVLTDLSIEESKFSIQMIPEYYYELYGRRDPRLKALLYEGKSYIDKNYYLSNVVSLEINKDTPNREQIALFADFLKDSERVSSWLSLNKESLETFSPINNRLDKTCYDYLNSITSSNLWNKIIGKIHYTINCDDNYSFDKAQILEYLSRFFKVGLYEVEIVPLDQINESNKDRYISLEKAIHITNNNSLQLGDIILIPKNLLHWIENLKIDDLRSLMSIVNFKSFSSAEKSLFEKLDPTYMLKEDPKDFTESYSSFAIGTMLVDLINEEMKKNQARMEKDNSDFVSVLVETTLQTIEEKARHIFFNDNQFLEFLVDKGMKRALKNVNMEIEKSRPNFVLYNSKLQFNNQEIDKIENQIANLQDLIDNANFDKEFLEEYQKIQNDLRYTNIIIDSLKENLLIKTQLLNLYKDDINQTGYVAILKNTIASYRSLLNDELEKKKNKLQRIDELENTYNFQSFFQNKKDLTMLFNKLKDYKTKNEDLKSVMDLKNRQNAYWKKLKTFLLEMESSTNLVSYFRNAELLYSLDAFQFIFDASIFTTFHRLGLASIDEKGEYRYDFSLLTQGDTNLIRNLFYEKSSINDLNRYISFLNSLLNKSSSSSLVSLFKLLNIQVPKPLIDLLNTPISILGSDYFPKNGINISPYEIYGKTLSSSISISSFVGFISSGFVRGYLKTKRGKSTSFLYGLLGGVVGAVIGGVIGGGTTYNYYNDGKLDILPLNKSLERILDSLEDPYESSKNYYHVFSDLYEILTSSYNEKINRVLKNFVELFIKNNEFIERQIYSFNSRFKNEKLDGYQIASEVFKSLVFSPYLWNAIFSSSKYKKHKYSKVKEFKEEEVEYLFEKTRILKSTWESFIDPSNQAYIDELLKLESTIRRWFIDSSLTPTHFTKKQRINSVLTIGYDSSSLSRQTLQSLKELYLETLNVDIDFRFIDLNKNPFAKVDAKFVVSLLNKEHLDFSSLHPIQQRLKERLKTNISIPLFKTKLVLVTNSLYDKYHSLTSLELEKLINNE